MPHSKEIEIRQHNAITTARYDYTACQLDILFYLLSKSIQPYLFELKNNFTSYQLHSALKLTSKYAKRIYQLASQWKDIGETCVYPLDELKTMFGLKDPQGKKAEQFERISDLKKKVLDVAVRQINEHTDLSVSYHLIKESRSFQAVLFYITTQKPQQLPIQFDRPIEETRYNNARQVLDGYGIQDPKLIQQILSDEKLTDSLFKFNYDMKTGRKKADKNPGGLLLKVLGLR